ncbi:hypothetical protein HPGCJGGD_1008 [Methylobacterium haplocladii]|nr:hypothetical protein HPGCJGGD_1008 [Methylobacterium haplocladii]
MTRHAEQLRAGVVLAAQARKPRAAATQNGTGHRDRLDVVHRRGTAVEAHICRERRLQPRHPLLALEALQQRRLLAADIRAGAVVDVDVEGVAVDVVLADELGRVGLVDRALQRVLLGNVFTADVDVAGMRRHREGGDQAALDQEVRIVPHDLSVLAGAGLRFVGIDDEIVRPPVRLLRHERPLQAGREAGATAAAQAGALHLVDDPVPTHVEQELGAVPSAALLRRVEIGRVQAVEVGEDAILIGEHGLLLSPSSQRARPPGRPSSRGRSGPGRRDRRRPRRPPRPTRLQPDRSARCRDRSAGDG